MLCVTVGEKLALARRYHVPALGQKELASRLGISTSTVGRWESTDHIPPAHLYRLSEILDVQEDWFFDGGDSLPTEARRSAQSAKPVHSPAPIVDKRLYNPSVIGSDSLLDPETSNVLTAAADSRTIRVAVVLGEGSGTWSAKGAQRVELVVYAFLVEGGLQMVRIADTSLGLEMRGRVLVFRPDDFPHEGRYLLCASRQDPDLRSIRVVAGTQLVDPEGANPPLSLADWDVLGWAWAELLGGLTDTPDLNIRPRGIGPRRR